jgi:hypothetical protein
VENWRSKDPEKAKSKWREAAKKYHQNFGRKKRLLRYGLTIESFNSLLASQQGCCAICREVLKNPCVDHDHRTGLVRGILCHDCNRAIGMMRDSPDILRRAADYLIRVDDVVACKP